jgi:predicted RNase H-like nuclease (RuvC/YqgF family)
MNVELTRTEQIVQESLVARIEALTAELEESKRKIRSLKCDLDETRTILNNNLPYLAEPYVARVRKILGYGEPPTGK